MDSEYNSMTEQAGIYAGNRGVDIYIEGNTDLKGAVIDSKATADKNNLDTGTLTFSDIDNKAEYDTKGYGFSYSGLTNEEKKQGNRPVMQGDKGFIPAIPMASGDEDESTTQSAMADGTITIRNKEQQKQNVENLRRETQNTLNKLDKIFDRDKIEEKQELAGQFSELAFNAIHRLSMRKNEDGTETSKWNEEQKVMAHALVGYVSGELANSKSSFSTALTAGINKFVTEELLKDPKKEAYYRKHPEQLQWLSATLGAVIGQMANGDATSGSSIAASATKNNRGGLYLVEELDKNKVKNPDGTVTSTFYDSATKQEYTTVYQSTIDNYVKLGGNISFYFVSGEANLIFDKSGVYLSAGGSLGLNGNGLGGGVNLAAGSILDKNHKNIEDDTQRKKALTGLSSGYSFYKLVGGGHFTPESDPNISMNEVGVGVALGTKKIPSLPKIKYNDVSANASASNTWEITDFFNKIFETNLKKGEK